MAMELLPILRDLYCSHVTEYHGRDKTFNRGPLTDEVLRGHLEGRLRVGTYFDPGDGTVILGVIDLDNKENPDGEKPHAKRAAEALLGLGLSTEIFTSKGKGYHITVYFAEAVQAWAVRKVLTYAAEKAGRPGAEIFPKQDKVDVYIPPVGSEESARVGNFINLPFHGADLPRGRTALLDKGNGFDPYPDQVAAAEGIRKNSVEDLMAALAMIGEDSIPPPPKIAPPVGEKIVFGARNDTLTSLAGTMRRRGFSPQSIEAALLVENATKCSPPLPEDEVRKIAASIARYEPTAPIVAMHKNAAIDAAIQATERKGLFDDVRVILRNGIPPPVWLVKGLIEAGLIILFGPSGGGKSFIAMFLSFALATGIKFFGREVKVGPVIYVCGEGRSGAIRRFAALETHYGVEIPPGALFLSKRAVSLDASAVDLLREEIEAATRAAGCPPVLIVVDTLARSIVGNESAPEDMNVFIKAVDAISAGFNCAALVVHHTGHAVDANNRPRGGSNLPAAADSIIKCADWKLKWTKTKDSELPDSIPFVLKKIELGVDEDGEEINSAVIVEPGERAASAFRPQHGGLNLTPGKRLALETMIELSAKSKVCDGRRWVGLNEWRDEFAKRHWGDSKNSKNQAHRRDRESLVHMGLVSVENDCYAAVRPEDVARVEDLAMIAPMVKNLMNTGDRRQTATNDDIVAGQSGDTTRHIPVGDVGVADVASGKSSKQKKKKKPMIPGDK